MNFTENNEIIFDDDALIRLKDSPIAFKIKDLFEVVEFLKYLMNVCGEKMKKCDFNTLLISRINNDKIKLTNFLKGQFQKLNNGVKTIIPNNNKKLIQEEDIKPKSNPEVNNNKTRIDSNTYNKFKFKEKNNFQSNEKSENLFQVKPEIQTEIDGEFNSFKEKEDDYENFFNRPMFQYYAYKYYYDGN